MTDEDRKIKLRAQAREFPETMALFDEVRKVLAEQLFKTPVAAKAEREDIYTRVQALDALKQEMASILANVPSEQAIAEYAKRFATTG